MIKRLSYSVAALTVAIVSVVSALQAIPATALSGADFRAGRIMDDNVFFDANSLNSDQIQEFLNAKVPNCDSNGTQNSSHWNSVTGRYYTRAEWGAQNNNFAPYTCLKNYRADIPSIAADNYCKTLSSATYQTAANIISKISQACNISPKVLVILLQKEQGLVTDEWPWQQQYDKATGFACPDTAACDTQYSGFFNQVYRAARQFQVYTKLSTSFNFRTNRTSNIQYNPNSSCGSGAVSIETQATASLYNYTPYQPNNAALSNLNGTGDGCSAYGNRNFWVYYNNWFGSPLLSSDPQDRAPAQHRVETVNTATDNYVFYYDAFQQVIRMSVKSINGTTWTNTILDGSKVGGSGRVDGSMGSSIAATLYGDSIQVFYYDKTGGNLRHAWTSSGTWNFETLDGDRSSVSKIDSNAGINPTVAVYQGQLQLFYYDKLFGNLRHTWTDANGWHFETLDGDRSSIARNDSDIGLTSAATIIDGSLQLFYTDLGRGLLRHSWTDANGWHFEALDGDRGSVSRTTSSVGMSPAVTTLGGDLQLFYFDYARGNLRHAWTTPNGWLFENLDGDRGSVARSNGDPEIGMAPTVINYNNDLQLFYHDYTSGNIRHAFTTPNGWLFENLDGDPGSLGHDDGNSGAASVTKASGATINTYYYNQSSGNLRRAWIDGSGWHFESIITNVVY